LVVVTTDFPPIRPLVTSVVRPDAWVLNDPQSARKDLALGVDRCSDAFVGLDDFGSGQTQVLTEARGDNLNAERLAGVLADGHGQTR
jgi:hypothetical protein